MSYLIPIIIGYLSGSINPAALIGKIKKVNLRKSGTGNLGATNTALMLGKRLGFAVMIFDIFKSAAAVTVSKLIFPAGAEISGLLAGSAAVIGHMHPFYMKFKGGKGLAAYGGLVLAYDPIIFLILFVVGMACMLIFNYCVALTTSAALLFPVAVFFKCYATPHAAISTATAAIISVWLIIRHKDNIIRAIRRQEPTTEFFFRKLFGKALNKSTCEPEATRQKDRV